MLEKLINNPESLQFSHFIMATDEGLIFVSVRDQDNKIYNFIIDQKTGRVSQQVKRNFEEVKDQRIATYIKEGIKEYFGILPTYHTKTFELFELS